jgi:16S rRNA (cytidine1402-2'-O)-methyltransferase
VFKNIKMKVKMNTLYIVGTPIGNLKDITFRAVETLQKVDFIACENTAHTIVLLKQYKINKPLVSYHKFSERQKSNEIIERILAGESCALVSDAGMPAISDPGAILVREAIDKGIKVESVPGVSAITTAISISGLDYIGFSFLGFLPEKDKDKRTILSNFKESLYPLVLYVAPHDLEKISQFLLKELGDRKVTAVKELTKIYETVYETSLSNFEIDNTKGEFVLIIHPAEKKELEDGEIIELIKQELQKGRTKKETVSYLSRKYNINKNRIYQLTL